MQERYSNIELMRIVAIIFIIAHHFLVHGMHIWMDRMPSNLALLSIDAMLYIGVNAFVLISGYNGVKFNWRKLLYLYIFAGSIAVTGYLLHLVVDGAHIGRSIFIQFFCAFSRAPWYLTCYVYLMLFAPLLNAGLEQFDKKKAAVNIAMLSVICLYFGWWCQDEVNRNGYNIINFIWLYCIGDYLRRYWTITFNRWLYAFIWIACGFLNALLYVYCPSYIAYTYNNPLVVLSAIAFFMFFLSFDFQSRFVNGLARGTLGVYLLHTGCYIEPWLYSDNVVRFYSQNIFCFAILVFCLYALCLMVDYIVRKVLNILPLNRIIHK